MVPGTEKTSCSRSSASTISPASVRPRPSLYKREEVSFAHPRGSKGNAQEVEVELSEHEEARERVDSDDPNGVLGL